MAKTLWLIVAARCCRPARSKRPTAGRPFRLPSRATSRSSRPRPLSPSRGASRTARRAEPVLAGRRRRVGHSSLAVPTGFDRRSRGWW